VRFLQSVRDFPQMVSLGDKTPSFGFNRFKQGLQFTPVDDEGFTLRGNRQQLLYNGRRRSHRFTILGNTAFEYDCILEREPDGNVVTLLIDGAENFDFFRQPDFVENPFLQGSYAVYKKVTLLGEGTGKLCHIHRPLIIDARGRRCWGSLAIVGNELRITIPEKWLSEAKYPVVVDPVIGTNTIGSLELYYEGSSRTSFFSKDHIVLNKVLIPENIGEINSFYAYKANYFSQNRFTRPYPCLYNNVNDLPNTKISVNEQIINDPYQQTYIGWVQGDFSKNCPINAGDYIWFGLTSSYFCFCFDYGGILERIDISKSYLYNNIVLPDIVGDSYYSPFVTTQAQRNLKISMYFTYVGQIGNNYSKYLTETARINDNLLKKQTFIKHCIETARINMTLNASVIFDKICHIIDNLRVNDTFSKAQTFFRKCVITASNSMSVNGFRFGDTMRSVFNTVLTETRLYIKVEYNRKCMQVLNAITTISKAQTFLRTCILSAGNSMSINGKKINAKIGSVADKIATETKLYIQVEYIRKCTQTMKIKTYISKTQSFFRHCKFTAGNSMWLNGAGKNKLVSSLIEKIIANSRLIAIKGISAKINDRVKAEGIVKRKLSVLLRIMTNAIVRSFINKRFLKATVEITLKSRIGEIK